MKIIIQKKAGMNQWDYPDTPVLFTNGFTHPDDSSLLIVDNESGKTLTELSENVPYSVVEYSASSLIPINITGIAGAVTSPTELVNVICYEETNVTITGTLAIPDDSFRLPVRRSDTGRTYYFLAQVVSGAFSVTLNFPVSGEFRYSPAEANLSFDQPLFDVDTVMFTVLRKIS